MRNVLLVLALTLLTACAQTAVEQAPTATSEPTVVQTLAPTPTQDPNCVVDEDNNVKVCKREVAGAEVLVYLSYSDVDGRPLVGTCRIKVIGPNPKEGWEENCAIKTAEAPLEMKPAEFAPGGVYEAEQILLLVRRESGWENAIVVDISSLLLSE